VQHIRGTVVLAIAGIALSVGVPVETAVAKSPPRSPAVSVSSKYVVTTTVPVGSYPVNAAVDPNTHKLFVANDADDSVSVIDGNTYKVENTVMNVGAAPSAVAVDPRTARVFIGNFQGSSVSAMDAVTDHNLGYASTYDAQFITSGQSAVNLAVDSKNQKVYAGDRGSGQLSEISEGSMALTRDNTAVETDPGPTGSQPNGIALDTGRKLIFISDLGDDRLSVLSTGGAIKGTISLEQYGGAPDALYYEEGTNRLFVAMWSVAGATGNDARYGQILVLNGSTLKKIDSIPMDIDPSDIAADPADHVIVVANQASGQGGLADPGTLTFINDKTLKVEQTVPVGLTTTGVAIDRATHTVYAVNDRSNDVTVVNLKVSSGPGTISYDASSYSAVAGSKAKVTVVRTGDTNLTSTVKYKTSDGSAKAPKDYKKTNGKLTFAKGERLKSFTVKTKGRGTKGTRKLHLKLTKVTGGTLKNPKAAILKVHESAAPQFTSLPPGGATTTGKSITFKVVASGRPAPAYTVLSGALPPGVTLSKTGVLSGKPTEGGVFTFTIRAANKKGSTRSGPIQYTVSAPVKFVDPETTLTAQVNQPWNGQNYPIKAFPNYNITWLVVGSLPPGVSMNSGLLYGTPTQVGTFHFKLSAENSVPPAAVTPTITMTVTN
jgi:YVTN family beta-propeller protein